MQPPQRPHLNEVELGSRQIAIEHKKVYFNLRQNQLGRFLKIAEVVKGNRSTIIIPESGWATVRDTLDAFIHENGGGAAPPAAQGGAVPPLMMPPGNSGSAPPPGVSGGGYGGGYGGPLPPHGGGGRGRGAPYGGGYAGAAYPPPPGTHAPPAYGGGGGGAPRYGGARVHAHSSEPTDTVWVENLPYQTDDAEIRMYFEQCGTITRCRIERRPNGESKGAATVTYTDLESAQRAIRELNGTDVGGRRIGVRTYYY